jgi:hypothetical protein
MPAFRSTARQEGRHRGIAEECPERCAKDLGWHEGEVRAERIGRESGKIEVEMEARMKSGSPEGGKTNPFEARHGNYRNYQTKPKNARHSCAFSKHNAQNPAFVACEKGKNKPTFSRKSGVCRGILEKA